MMTFFHLYLKYTQPLFIQALMGLKNLYDAKPVAIHILGKPADGELKRPWKAQSMFGGMFLFGLSFVASDADVHISCIGPADGQCIHC